MTRRVVYFVDSAGFGGTEQVLLTLVEALDRERWRSTLLHRAGAGSERLVERAARLGIETQPVPQMAGKRGLARLPQLVRGLRRQGPDVFHAHLNWPLACTYGLLAAVLARIPAIVATQHLFVDRQPAAAVLKHKLVSTWVDRYITVSRSVAHGLEAVCLFSDRKIQVIENAVSCRKYDRPPAVSRPAGVPEAAGRPVILSVARLHRQKGLEYLVSAAPLVPKALFLVAGDGQEDSRLQAQARALGVADRVIFLGYRDDVPELLAACDLFVLPSLFEGLPVAVLEAMAAGKPVIASAIGGTDEAIVNGKTGLLIPPRDPAALARAICTLLSDCELAGRLAAAAKVRVRERFSADTMVQRVTGLYEEVLASPRAAHGRRNGRR